MRYFNIPQWIWRRLPRRCPSRVRLTLYPGGVWSSVRNPLYGLNYKAGQWEEEKTSLWSIRLHVLWCPDWEHLWILRLSPPHLRLWWRGRNLLATSCWSSLAWWVLGSLSHLGKLITGNWNNNLISQSKISVKPEGCWKKFNLFFLIILPDRILLRS